MAGVYFALAFAITWSLQMPALLAKVEVIPGPPEKYMALVGLGAFGPMFAAMIASTIDGSGVKALFRPLRIWNVGWIWYAIALLGPGLIFIAVALPFGERLFYLPSNAAYVLAAICFPFGEEVGWRGYALPRLQDRIGPLAASAVIGIFWMLWHIPMLTLQGVGPLL
jgi:membrane protease YdiL (CAAX protease family)